MRLTLRTLLAYLDRILDEGDGRELERKIQESELATQLVHRIRSVMSQRRLGALDVRAGGLGRDANSVAEYLDNTLPVEQIPDFERVCLESDVHLSEVAACHHILTLVLGEPAAIPDGLKEKIYQWSTRRMDRAEPVPGAAEQSPTAVSPPPVAAPSRDTDGRSPVEEDVLNQLLASDTPGTARRVDAPATRRNLATAASNQTWDEDEHWTEAPDYLKRARSAQWKPVAVGGLILVLLAMAALRGMGPLNRTHPLAQRFGLFQAPAGPGAAADMNLAQAATNEASNADAGRMPRTDAASPRSDASEPTAPALPPADTADETDPDEQLTLPAAPATAADDPRFEDRVANEETAADEDQTALDAALPVDLAPASDQPQADETISPRPDALADESATELLTDESTSIPPDDGDELTGPLSRPDGGTLDEDSTAAVPTNLTETDEGETPDAADAGADVPVTDPAGRAAATTVAEPAADRPFDGPALIDPLATSRPDATGTPAVPPEPVPRAITDAGAPNAAPTVDAADSGAAPPTPRTSDVGRFLDPQQVLVKLDGETPDWQRVPVGTQLQVGDLLMSLPAYRAPLVLASGMQLTLIGGTRLEVLDLDEEATPYFRFEFGRLTVATFTQGGAKLGLQWAKERTGVLTLDEISTTLALELWPEHIPGTDPQTAPHQVLHIYVTSGNAEWVADQGPPITITAGQRLTLIDDYHPLLKDVEEQPSWIEGQDTRPIDLLAARNLAQQLSADRPVMLVLKEEADNRRREIRSLAVSSLAYLGHFDPLFVALNDPELRAYWASQVDVLQRVPHLSPEYAEAVKQAVVQRHGEDEGMAFYRMLWGYTPDQLAEAGAADLFEYLDHSSMDFRVLASELLKSITGQTLLYSANARDRDPQRRAAVARWRKMLDEGQITYKQPPEIVSLLSELAPDQP